MSQTESIDQLAARLGETARWVREHWRQLPGLPAPIIPPTNGRRAKWRTADLDRYFSGELPAVATEPYTPPPPANRPKAPDLTAQVLAAAGVRS